MVQVMAFTFTDAQVDQYDAFMDRISHGGMDGGAVNLVLSCVDNYGARLAINKVLAIALL